MESYKNRLPLKTVKLFMFQIFRALEFCHARRILHRDLKPQNLLITKQQELKLADFGLARAKSIPTKTYSSEVATLWYRPPDVLLGDRNYSGHIDVWGAGCIFYEMAVGRTPFPGESKDNQIQLIFQKLGIPPEAYWPGLRENEKFQQLVLTNTPNITLSSSQFNSSVSKTVTKEPDETAEIQAYTSHLRGTLTERVTSLDKTGIDLLTQCLHLLGSRRITAEDALTHPYFDGILPKGIRVQQLSPEQSVIVNPDELSQIGTNKSKKEPSYNNFMLKKQLAASMDDVRIASSLKSRGAYDEGYVLQPPIKSKSRSSHCMFSQMNSDNPIDETQIKSKPARGSSFNETAKDLPETGRDLAFRPRPSLIVDALNSKLLVTMFRRTGMKIQLHTPAIRTPLSMETRMVSMKYGNYRSFRVHPFHLLCGPS
ncbi:unnamed protein product [Echinostoma caproni]|uniref:Protein kinase domain-containing protein n=1 Tax=Echinostoma caproni TaxID=27848 RepID=A0A183AFL2_9TREM|nr:unnamed protein product [Echinostoma caproni]